MCGMPALLGVSRQQSKQNPPAGVCKRICPCFACWADPAPRPSSSQRSCAVPQRELFRPFLPVTSLYTLLSTCHPTVKPLPVWPQHPPPLPDTLPPVNASSATLTPAVIAFTPPSHKTSTCHRQLHHPYRWSWRSYPLPITLAPVTACHCHLLPVAKRTHMSSHYTNIFFQSHACNSFASERATHTRGPLRRHHRRQQWQAAGVGIHTRVLVHVPSQAPHLHKQAPTVWSVSAARGTGACFTAAAETVAAGGARR